MSPSLSAVEVASFANIPIPFSAIKLIVFLFITSEAACPNIPTDSRVFTCIVPSLIPVAFLLASIPIFSLSVAVVEANVIVPVFSAFTLALDTAVELFVTIIPADFLLLTFTLPLFVNVKADVTPVIAPSNNPNIPADCSAVIVISASFPSFFPSIVPPFSVNLT